MEGNTSPAREMCNALRLRGVGKLLSKNTPQYPDPTAPPPWGPLGWVPRFPARVLGAGRWVQGAFVKVNLHICLHSLLPMTT